MKLLEAQGMTKAYGKTRLLRDVRLTVSSGECVAVIGNNGSGKTTLLKMLAGLVRMDSGSVWKAPGLSMGYMPEHFPRGPLAVAEYLLHMGCIEGLGRNETRMRTDALLADFYMTAMEKTPMKHLSKGSLQKVGVIQALLLEHPLLLLDEPLSGQDIASQEVFLEKMRTRKQTGAAMLLSCHEPFLINRLADRVLEIKEQTLHEVSSEDPRFLEYATMAFMSPSTFGELPPLPPFVQVARVGEGIRLRVPSPQSDTVALAMLQAGFQLKEFSYADNQ